MNFEVNGTNYFLTVLPEEGQLALYAPTSGGVARLHIASDHGPVEIFPALVSEEGDEGNVILN